MLNVSALFSVFLLNNAALFGYTTIFFAHLPTDKHESFFHFLASINNTAMNIHIFVFSLLLDIYQVIELLNHMVNLFDSLASLVAQMVVSVYNAGDPGSIPRMGRFPGEGKGNPLQYSCLENPMDGGAW